MRVFLDTNVLVRAFATRGLCADVLRVILAEHELLLSDLVLKALKRTLTYKLGVPGETVRAIVDLLHGYVVPAKPMALPALDVRDPADIQVLLSAIGTRAEVLVTGDEDLLVVADEVSALRLTSPRGFWNQIQERHR